jgi:hypothetical protein
MPFPARFRRFAFPSLVSWLVFGLFFYLSDELDRLFNLSYGLVPLTILFAAIVFIVWITHIALNLTKKRWTRFALTLCAPFLSFALFHGLARAGLTPDWFHFQWTRTHYQQEVAAAPGPSPRHLRWNWGDTGSATGPNIFNTLVYAEDDRPLDVLHPGERNAEGTDVRPFGDHFFLVTQFW